LAARHILAVYVRYARCCQVKSLFILVHDYDMSYLSARFHSCALDAGINHIDACTNGDVMRYSKTLKGRRDKMYLAASHCGNETTS
jgi:hypothetical protein